MNHIVENMLDDLKDQLSDQLRLAEERGYERGLEESLQAQINGLKFKKGDVVVFKKCTLPRRVLEAFRVQLQSRFDIAGIICVDDETEIKEIGEMNLGLLGLERKR